MGDINIKQLESLRWRMRVIETLTVIGTAWIALAVYQKKEELVYYLVGAVVLLFLVKSIIRNSVCEKMTVRL